MTDEIKTKLDECIESCLDEVKSLGGKDADGKEVNQCYGNLEKIYRLSIDERKNEDDSEMKKKELKINEDKVRHDYELKKQELENERKKIELERRKLDFEKEKSLISEKESKITNKLKIVDFGIRVAELVLPIAFYAIWMNKGFRFEENGTYTSTTFRGLFNHFKPSKK